MMMLNVNEQQLDQLSIINEESGIFTPSMELPPTTFPAAVAEGEEEDKCSKSPSPSSEVSSTWNGNNNHNNSNRRQRQRHNSNPEDSVNKHSETVEEKRRPIVKKHSSETASLGSTNNLSSSQQSPPSSNSNSKGGGGGGGGGGRKQSFLILPKGTSKEQAKEIISKKVSLDSMAPGDSQRKASLVTLSNDGKYLVDLESRTPVMKVKKNSDEVTSCVKFIIKILAIIFVAFLTILTIFLFRKAGLNISLDKNV